MSLALLTIDRENFQDPPLSDERDAVEALRGGALVLMVGSFEAFLRNLFEERVDYVATLPGLRFDDLPPQMKATNVFGILDRAMQIGSQSKRIDRVPDIQQAAGSVARGILTADLFTDTRANPNPDTVKGLFLQVGYENLFAAIRPRFERHWGSPVASTFIRDELRSVVSYRHIVAHGQQSLRWSRTDVGAAVRFLRILGRTLDEELRIYLNQTTSNMR